MKDITTQNETSIFETLLGDKTSHFGRTNFTNWRYTASSILILGGIFYLIVHGQDTVPNYRDFVGEGIPTQQLPELLLGHLAEIFHRLYS
jgi:hypothetical protein